MPAASTQFNGFIPAISESLSASEPRQTGPGIFARFFKAVHDAQVRRAEREIARYIESSGGRLTDDLERRIERHFV